MTVSRASLAGVGGRVTVFDVAMAGSVDERIARLRRWDGRSGKHDGTSTLRSRS